MNKAVMISIQPKWVALIANGKKTVEVRKTKPKLETPFKVYIYCTTKGETLYYLFRSETLNGKVIGEFVCDKITPLFNVATTSWNLLAGSTHENAKGLVKMACLTEEEMHSYAKGKNCFAWHISNLVIYDKPKELSEFCRNGECDKCGWFENGKCYKQSEQSTYNNHRIKRPPQSWCYVEEQQ